MNNEKADEDEYSFSEIRERYDKLSKRSTGFQAQLGKRIGAPDELALIPAFYQLYPGITPTSWHYRAAFIVPFIRHSNTAPSLGSFIGALEVQKKIGSLERRMLQIARAMPHQDIIYLRRLLMRFDEPYVNWNTSGLAQFFSINNNKNANGKKMLIEQYFIARNKTGEGN